VAARRPSTYRQRVFVGGIVGVALVLFAVFTPSISSQSGEGLFKAMAWALFLFCILQGLRETADSLSQERREGTLGLLFLTDLRAYDVVLGKLTAAAVKAFAALLATLPAIVLPLWLGGVTWEQSFRVAVALAMALLLTMTAGLWISAMSRSAFPALLLGFLLCVTLMMVPWICVSLGLHIPRWTAGPLEMLSGTLNSQNAPGPAPPWPLVIFTPVPGTFWPAAIYSTVLCCLFFWLSGRALGKVSFAEPIRKPSDFWQRLMRPTIGLRNSWGGTPSDDPAAWLGERTLPGRKVLWILLGLVALAAFLLGLFLGNKLMFFLPLLQIVFGLLVKLWMAVLAVQPFNAARRNGNFELLLCTPVSPASLVTGQINALRAYFFVPGFLTAIGVPLIGFLGVSFFQPDVPEREMIPGLVFGLGWFLIFLIDMNALAYAGLWFGLTEPHLPQAVSKTVFRILILPWITLIVPIAGALGVFLWPWFWLAWADRKLNKHFHEEASNPFPAESGRPGWLARRFG